MKKFTNTAKFLHWGVAALIVSQYALAKLAENAKHHDKVVDQLALLANHKSVGITILALAVIRVLYRLATPFPKLPATMDTWQVRASNASHILLYGSLFALPISGWLMSSAKAYSVSWFNLIALPDVVAANEHLAEQLHRVHHFLAEALFVLALVHILAAMKHHFIDKDNVLTRMASKGNWLLFAFIIVLIIGLFGRVISFSPIDKQASTVITKSPPALNSTNAPFSLSDLPLWNIDYDKSYIKFSGDQAGAPFEGEWQRWSAEVQFDADQLNDARFNVSIDVASGFSNDQERDDTIRSVDFFNVVSFPNAKYQTSIFTKSEQSYHSLGKLTMKGVSADVIFNFNVNKELGILVGTASLDRLVWSIGIGDWEDPTWVGHNVTVSVHLVTKP